MTKHYSKKRKLKYLHQYAKGATVAEISKASGVHPNTIYNWLKRFPIKSVKKQEQVSLKEHKDLESHLHKNMRILSITQLFIDSFHPTAKEKYQFMDSLIGQYPLRDLCEALQVDRGTYYNHLRNKDTYTKQKEHRAFLCQKIIELYEEGRGGYGARRIYLGLKQRGIPCSKEMVVRLMRDMNIRSVRGIGKKNRYQEGWNTRRTNLLLGGENITRPNQAWTSDITEFRLNNHTYSICIYMDYYSRKILCARISRNASTNLVKRCLKESIRARKPPTGLILHTDQGGQYFSYTMEEQYRKLKIRHSTSQKATPQQNGRHESGNSTLKQEFLYQQAFTSLRQLEYRLARFVEFYNDIRIHTALDGLSPSQYEQEYYNHTTKDAAQLVSGTTQLEIDPTKQQNT